MEEFVGKLWHRFITRTAERRFPEAVVTLPEMRRSVGVMFRALGGDGGARIENATRTEFGGRRSLLQKIAGTHTHVELGWRDQEALHLPERIDLLPSRELNRDLYLWLAALASGDSTDTGEAWLIHNQRLTLRVIACFPGMASRYRRLVEAVLPLRPDPAALPAEEAERERTIRQALQRPGSVEGIPDLPSPPAPVLLWLHPTPPGRGCRAPAGAPVPAEQQGEVHRPEEERRYRAEEVEMPDGKKGLVMDRFENIFGWAEFIKVDRATEEDDDLSEAEQAAKDLDHLSVARDQKASAKRIRFDLDLPSAESDDTPLGDGILVPEWDYRKGILRPDHCRIQPMIATDAEPVPLPPHLRAAARRIRAQFESLMPTRVWHRAQPEGGEVDLEAYLDFVTERALGHAPADSGLYRDFRGSLRDLSCLLLADLSLSTDTWVSNESRVIDVIRDSLMLFAEALSATGDPFAIYGFSSRHRDHVRFHILKNFREHHSDRVRGRIQVIRPGFYTRMGAAIRQASSILEREPTGQKLLLLITDGKPNDLDQYDGRYGIEDTRMALIEARQKGLQPFCVTIDDRASDYLPHLFGPQAYVVIRNPEDLPRQLPLLYARLTGH